MLLYGQFSESCLFHQVKVKSCLTLCHPVCCSPPGSSIHGILQARVLEWVAISFSSGSSRPWDRTQVSCIAGRCFTLWATRVCEPHVFSSGRVSTSIKSTKKVNHGSICQARKHPSTSVKLPTPTILQISKPRPRIKQHSFWPLLGCCFSSMLLQCLWEMKGSPLPFPRDNNS